MSGGSLHALMFFRAVIGCAFLLAFVGKVRDLSSFRAAISAFELVPDRWIRRVAALVLLAEAAVVVLMLRGGPVLDWGFWLAALLLGIFTGIIALTLKRRIQMACNCFGPHTMVLSRIDLLRNTGFLACSLLGAGLSSMDIVAAHPSGWEWVVITVIAVMLVGLWVELGELANLFR